MAKLPPKKSAGLVPRRGNVLVILSGLHPSLPESEVLAVAPSRVVTRRGRLLLIESRFPEELDRLGLSMLVLDFLGVGDDEGLPFDAEREVSGTFAVRVSGPTEDRKRQLYRMVWRSLHRPRVDLSRPETELHAYVQPEGIWWARARTAIGDAQFAARRLERRPFHRSYGTQPRRSRCLINLAGVPPGGRLLDPCCGTGSYLIEAALMGIDAYGSDADPAAVRGTLANLAATGLRATVMRRDARRLDGWRMRFDAVVTDLPYGLSASTGGSVLTELYAEILTASALLLGRGRNAVFVAPSGTLPVPDDLFSVLERHPEPVHRALTRETVVLARR